jgi:hypothetical protein
MKTLLFIHLNAAFDLGQKIGYAIGIIGLCIFGLWWLRKNKRNG